MIKKSGLFCFKAKVAYEEILDFIQEVNDRREY